MTFSAWAEARERVQRALVGIFSILLVAALTGCDSNDNRGGGGSGGEGDGNQALTAGQATFRMSTGPQAGETVDGLGYYTSGVVRDDEAGVTVRRSGFTIATVAAGDTTIITLTRPGLYETPDVGEVPIGGAGFRPDFGSTTTDAGDYTGSYVRVRSDGLVIGFADAGRLVVDEVRRGIVSGRFEFDGSEIAIGESFFDSATAPVTATVEGRFRARIVTPDELADLVETIDRAHGKAASSN